MDCWSGGAGVGFLLHPSFSWLFFSHDHSPIHEHHCLQLKTTASGNITGSFQQRHQTSRVVGGGHFFKSQAVIVVLALWGWGCNDGGTVLGRAGWNAVVLAMSRGLSQPYTTKGKQYE
jgi:hypothetical protein